VRITSVTRPEIGFCARSGVALRDEAARPPLSLMPVEYLTPAIEERAMEVQALLAGQGSTAPRQCQTRSSRRLPSVPASPCFTWDKDYELIAELTD
jgi:hypothetical protein